MTEPSARPAPETLAALARVPLFAPLPPPLRAAMARASTLRTVAPGTAIAAFGAPAQEVFIVLDGHVKLTAAGSSIDVVGPGAVIGLGAVTGVATHPTGAEAVDTVRGVAVDGAQARSLLAGDMTLVLRMLGSLSGALRGLVGQLNDLKQRTTTQRLGMYLLELGGQESGEVRVRLPYGKKVVAEKLGMTPESLSRALAALEALGVRQEAPGVLTIAEAADLADHCGYVGEDEA